MHLCASTFGHDRQTEGGKHGVNYSVNDNLSIEPDLMVNLYDLEYRSIYKYLFIYLFININGFVRKAKSQTIL